LKTRHLALFLWGLVGLAGSVIGRAWSLLHGSRAHRGSEEIREEIRRKERGQVGLRHELAGGGWHHPGGGPNSPKRQPCPEFFAWVKRFRSPVKKNTVIYECRKCNSRIIISLRD